MLLVDVLEDREGSVLEERWNFLNMALSFEEIAMAGDLNECGDLAGIPLLWLLACLEVAL